MHLPIRCVYRVDIETHHEIKNNIVNVQLIMRASEGGFLRLIYNFSDAIEMWSNCASSVIKVSIW